MKKAILMAAALLAITAGSAMAVPGVNLSWTDCDASLGGGLNRTSTCASNSGTAGNLYGTYVLPADADALAGNDIVLDIMTGSATLPCWWNFATAPRNTGTSWTIAFNTVCADANAVGVFDYWASTANGPSGGPAVFLMPTNATPRVRFRAVVAVDASQAGPVPASTPELYSFTFSLKNANTVGACTGCTTPACFVLNLIRVTQIGFPFMELTTAASRAHAFWQGGAVSGSGCPLAVPTQNKTWGSVKALYR